MAQVFSADLATFYKHNIIDSCSISNILSSLTLYRAAQLAQCQFYCTHYVIYECLHKRPNNISDAFQTFRQRLNKVKEHGDFQPLTISIEDLQEVEILESRKKLAKGELSSIVMAKKLGQAFMTDDQKARRLACKYMEPQKVQTTPHLFGWLIFTSALSDGDKDLIISEHNKMGRPLAKVFDTMYLKALELRLASRN